MPRLVFDGLAANATSNAFRVDADRTTWVTVDGDLSSQTVGMHVSPNGTNYDALYADGNVVQFTVAGSSTKFDLHPGMFYRFTVSNGGTPDVDIYVDGAVSLV